MSKKFAKKFNNNTSIIKTLIISTSLNKESKGFTLCQKVKTRLQKNKNHKVELIDVREYEINHIMQPMRPDMQKLQNKFDAADNFIFGFAVYNYNINDAFASVIGNLIHKKEGKLYGLVGAAGGDMSYLVGSIAHQMLMTHNRMIPLPRILYGGKSWDGKNLNTKLEDRIAKFCNDFFALGQKLL